jgi:hypothetical protein
MGYSGASVTSKGNVSATFRVPGLVTIPCDGDAHNFTIVELALKAAMSWVSVPKIDPKTHLNVCTNIFSQDFRLDVIFCRLESPTRRNTRY